MCINIKLLSVDKTKRTLNNIGKFLLQAVVANYQQHL